jgi:hypothetical protein
VKLPKPESVPAEVQEFCQELVTNQGYRAKIKVSFTERTLPTNLEAMIWYYAAGKPPEKIEHTFVDEADLRNATKEQLAERLQVLHKQALALKDEMDEPLLPLTDESLSNETSKDVSQQEEDESIH